MQKLILSFILIFTPFSTFAASAELVPRQASVQVKDVFAVDVFLNSTENVNAIEGSIQFSPTIALTDINFSNSIVPLWVTPPAEREKGTISFAGVIPGGYAGNASMFTLIFIAEAQGRSRIAFTSDTKTYVNDGIGTPETVTASPREFLIVPATSTPRSVIIDDDILPPEPFVPSVISGEPFSMSGKVLVFIAQDKSSGVMRYEIASSYFNEANEDRLSWQTATSPYLLTKKDALRYLYIRAIDQRGNARVVIVPPQTFSPIALMLRCWPLFVALLIAAVILIRQRYVRTHINRTV